MSRKLLEDMNAYRESFLQPGLWPTVHRSPGRPEKTPGNRERLALYETYEDKLIINADLTRALVSFQANRAAPFYRWLKYKEAFSCEFVRYVLNLFPSGKQPPRLLDPFAGAGTAISTASKLGWRSTGIELLPIGVSAIRARQYADRASLESFERTLRRLQQHPFDAGSDYRFPHLRITLGAFPRRTEIAFSAFDSFLRTIEDEAIHFLFRFAWLSVLENVSYTRKDGQYLRWDPRSGKCAKKKAPFDKGTIPGFRAAVLEKLGQMLEDISARNESSAESVKVIEGSCLGELPLLPNNAFDLALTSPPYCNRYDYTRTYALELAFLGYTTEAVRDLRQSLLSCTVENKTKREQLNAHYRARGQQARYDEAVDVFERQAALQEVLRLLYAARKRGELNNNNIPGMVENYFFEMNLVIRDLARTLSAGGRVVMVNDNVQYQGEEVPVDLILSDFAAKAGLSVDSIWVLPRGKGNSSQQMGAHGRNEIRKCVYIWRKAKEKLP